MLLFRAAIPCASSHWPRD